MPRRRRCQPIRRPKATPRLKSSNKYGCRTETEVGTLTGVQWACRHLLKHRPACLAPQMCGVPVIGLPAKHRNPRRSPGLDEVAWQRPSFAYFELHELLTLFWPIPAGKHPPEPYLCEARQAPRRRLWLTQHQAAERMTRSVYISIATVCRTDQSMIRF